MIYLLAATLLVGYIAALIFTLIMGIDNEDWRWIAVFAVLVIFLFAFAMKMASQGEDQGPCVKYETSWSYNAATKTNMPYKVCAERGEWIK